MAKKWQKRYKNGKKDIKMAKKTKKDCF